MTIRSAIAIVALATGAPAFAETVHVKIADGASYEQALVCFQFHGVSAQVMKAASESPQAAAEEKARLETMSGFAGFVQAHWRAHIDTVKGERSKDQLNADLKSMTSHVIADAQAGLDGDAAARERQREVELTCLGFEERKVVADAE